METQAHENHAFVRPVVAMSEGGTKHFEYKNKVDKTIGLDANKEKR